MKKLWIGIIIVVLLALAITLVVSQWEDKSQEVKVGAVLVLTGPDAKAGQSAKQGIDAAIEAINSKGGVRGRKVGVIYEDDQGDPAKATSAVLKLINMDKVPAIIGPMWSSSVLAVAPIAEKNKVVILSPTASNPKITHAGDYIFRNTYSDAVEGAKTAEFAFKEMGYRRVALLFANNDYGVGLKDAYRKRFEEFGGVVVVEEGYDPKSTDFRTSLTKTKEKKPDAIYLAGYSEMGHVLRQAKELGVEVPFLSCIMFEISDIMATAKEAAEGVIYAYPSYDPEEGGELTRTFARDFEGKYGILPDPEAAFSYDAMKILSLAMEKGGFQADSIRRSLYQIKEYQGVTGETTFDENGDVVKPVGFKKAQSGKYVWVKISY